MKKILIIVIFIACVFYLPVRADELDTGGIEDVMEHTGEVENAFDGQKKITDEDFQKTLQQVKDKKNKKMKKNKELKGKSFNEENNGDFIKDTADKNIILLLPLELTNEDGTEIPIGHYKIVGTQQNGNTYLDFYQSSNLVARVPATETSSDFNETDINFAKILPYNNKKVEIIYGSMDFNAYSFIRIKKEISDYNQ